MVKLPDLIKDNKNELLILFCYTISYGLIILNKGLFWDDWVWINRDLASFREVGNQMGTIWFQFWAFFAYSNVILTKYIVFIFNLVTILIFFKIISKHLNRNQSYLLTLFFAIIPINYARTMICISQYSLCLMLFFIGFYIVAENINRKKRIFRIISYVFFFFSFEMNSLLFFYLIVALYVWWRENNFKKIIKTIIYYSDYILLVVIYVIIKKEYFIPSGSYSNYNSFSISRILKFPIKLMYTIYDFTIKLFNFSIFNSLKSPLIVILFIVIYFAIRNKSFKDIRFNTKYLYLSFFLIFAALFPYVIVGKKPVLFGWANRHSILLGSGLAFLLYSLYSIAIQNLSNNIINKIILSLIISSFILFNIDINKEMLIYSYKTDSILFNFKESEIIKSNTTFLFEDISEKNDKDLINKSIDSFYIFNGMMHTVFGDETRFMVSDIKSYDKYKNLSKQYPFLRYSDWAVREIQYKVSLVDNNKIYGRNFYKLLFYSLFNPEKYYDLSKSLYVLEFEKFRR